MVPERSLALVFSCGFVAVSGTLCFARLQKGRTIHELVLKRQPGCLIPRVSASGQTRTKANDDEGALLLPMSPWEAARRGGNPALLPESCSEARASGSRTSSKACRPLTQLFLGHLPDSIPHFQAYLGGTDCSRTSAKGFCGGEDGCSVGRQCIFSPRVTLHPRCPSLFGQRTRKTSYSWIVPAKSSYWKCVGSTLLS